MTSNHNTMKSEIFLKKNWLDSARQEGGEYIKRGRTDLSFIQIRRIFRERKRTNVLISKYGEILIEIK